MMVVILILFHLAGLAEGIMDWLQFRLPLQIRHKWVYHRFWDPRRSWQNKWKRVGLSGITNKERFFLSSTIFVFLTDGWHLMKWCRNRFIDIAFVLVMFHFEIGIWWSILLIIIFRIAYGIGFWLTFKKLL